MNSQVHHPLPGLASYWPRLEEVLAIGTEAEALPDAVLLAVHRHVDMLRQPFSGTAAGQRVQEDALLEFVLHGLKPEGYLLAPVTGPSGAGKSHLVRWLEIRLRHHPAARAFNIIRVPKSASLRTVVESVLEPVAHRPEYAGLLQEVRDAASALAPDEAAALFGTMLQLALKDRAAAWKNESGSIDGMAVSMLAPHAQMLPGFLQDPVISPHFLEKVYPRLLKRALRGRDEADADADRAPQFEAADLTLPADLVGKLSEAARTTQVYYSSKLDRPDGRTAALAALNAVVDNAVARVFKLGQSAQGKTLQDIMREIRETLHASGRELVLLVEDFYALTGIQDQLLQMCIQGTHDGPRPMCPMRTVMAMTDSTLDGRDTIKTRSEYRWALVTEENDEQRVVDALVELAGSYLNAARIGQARLRASYDAEQGTVQTRYVAEADDPDSSDLRQAFGTTQGGVPLFPLSRNAIHFLARKHLTSGGRLRFIPRVALQFIVRDVLKKRDAFEQGTFPAGLDVEETLAVELSRVLAGTPESLRPRYQRTIVCWGNDPRTPAELQGLPAQVFQAFNLKPLDQTGRGPSQPPVLPRTATPTAPGLAPGSAVSPAVPAAPPPPTAEDPVAAVNARWRQTMDDWSRGKRLQLRDTQALRKAIHAHVTAHVDWNALSLHPHEFDVQSFELPNALGQDRKSKPTRPVLAVSGPGGAVGSAEPELALELLALLRFDAVKCWDYDGGDQDALYVAEFLDRMAHQVERAALRVAEIKLVPLAHGAVRSGIVRRGPQIVTLTDRLGAALAVDDPEPVDSGARAWDELRRDCWSQREALRHALLRYLHVVQGDATTPHGVDAARFARAVKATPLDAAGIGECLSDDGEAEPLSRLLGRLTNVRLTPTVTEAQTRAREWADAALVRTGLKGAPDEPAALTQAALTLMDDAMNTGAWPAPPQTRAAPLPTHPELVEAARRFAALPWVDLVSSCQAVLTLQPAHFERAASALARLSWNELRSASSFLESYSLLLDALERRVTAEETVLGQGDAGPAIAAMSNDLGTMQDGLLALARA